MNVQEATHNPMRTLGSRARLSVVKQRFGSYLTDDRIPEDFILALYPFAATRPLCFFNSAALSDALRLFEQDPMITLKGMQDYAQQLSHGINSILRVGTSWKDDLSPALKTPLDLIQFEQIWHPEYQRYSEHIFNNLLRLPLAILGHRAGKDYQSSDLAVRVQHLPRHGFGSLVEGYDAIVRNAISHGSSYYEDYAIKYVNVTKTKTVESELTVSEFQRLFDTLIDTCHALAIAIFIFLCRQHSHVQSTGLVQLPAGCKLLLLQGASAYRGLSVEALIFVRGGSGKETANITCRSNTFSRLVHIIDGLAIAASMQKMTGSSCDLLVISYFCGPSVPSTLMIDMIKFRAASPTDDISQLTDAVRGELLWHDASQLSYRWNRYRIIAAELWGSVKTNIVTEWRNRGLKVWRSRYEIRTVENYSVQALRRLYVYVVLAPNEPCDRETLRGVFRNAISRLKWRFVRNLEISGEGPWPSFPSYIYIRLHTVDARVRTLKTKSYRDVDLVAEAEWISVFRRHKPVFVRQPSEFYRGIRIRYIQPCV